MTKDEDVNVYMPIYTILYIMNFYISLEQNLLLVLCSCNAAVDSAYRQNDLKTLEEALSSAERSQLAYFFKRTTWYKQAEERHKKLRRLSLITKNFASLHPTHVRHTLKKFSMTCIQ